MSRSAATFHIVRMSDGKSFASRLHCACLSGGVYVTSPTKMVTSNILPITIGICSSISPIERILCAYLTSKGPILGGGQLLRDAS